MLEFVHHFAERVDVFAYKCSVFVLSTVNSSLVGVQ